MSAPENTNFVPPADPWELFSDWYALAQQQEVNDANAMSVATVGSDGFPSVRVLLMKEYNPFGFVFYTNRQSR